MRSPRNKYTVLFIFLCIFMITYKYGITFVKHKPPMTEELKDNICDGRKDKTHQRVLSYSLFGNGTRWNSAKGAKYRECVSLLAQQIRSLPMYRDWKIRIYHDNGDLARKTKSDHSGNQQIQFNWLG